MGFLKIIPIWVKIKYFEALSKINFHISNIIIDPYMCLNLHDINTLPVIFNISHIKYQNISPRPVFLQCS